MFFVSACITLLDLVCDVLRCGDVAISIWLPANCHMEATQNKKRKKKETENSTEDRKWSGRVVGEHAEVLDVIKLGCV